MRSSKEVGRTAYYIFVVWLCLLKISFSTPSGSEEGSEQECMLRTASTTCHHYYRISDLKFHAFIKPDSLDKTCRQSHGALNCVDKLLVGCPDMLRTPFIMQKYVLKAICQDRRHEYLNSSNCFSVASLQRTIVYNCLSKGANQSRLQTDPCSLVQEIVTCVKDTVTMTKECGFKDVHLMRSLVQGFLMPLCQKPKKETKRTEVPAPKPTPKSSPSELKSKQNEKNSAVSLYEFTFNVYVLCYLYAGIFSTVILMSSEVYASR